MRITADDLVPWACKKAVAYIATTYPKGMVVDEPFLRRWAAGQEWKDAHWTDLARAAVQINPAVVFAFANMALEYAARVVPALAPFVGTIVDIPTARAAARAARAADATSVAVAGARAAARAAAWAVRAAEWAARAADATSVAVAAEVAADAVIEAAEGAWAEAQERIVALCIATILGGERE